MIDQIKTLRVKIDGLAQLTKELKPVEHEMYGSIGKNPLNKLESEWSNILEIKKAYDSLILTKAWLGKILGELGTESPYKSGYKEVSNIEPTADVQEWIYYNDGFKDKSHIEKVDWLRTEIEIIIKEVENLRIDATKRKLIIYITNAFTHLSEARFWLGFELQRIKEESK